MDRKGILSESEKCVCQDREQAYGSPEDNFKTIAEFWETYLNAVFDKDERNDNLDKTYTNDNRTVGNHIMTAEDVAIMMCLLKIGRIASGQTKADNYIDLVGYAACAGEIATNTRANESGETEAINDMIRQFASKRAE